VEGSGAPSPRRRATMGASLGTEGDLGDRRPAALSTLYTPGHKVEFAATPLGPGVPGMQAYHTSVVVDEMEYSFSFEGVTHGPNLMSHRHLPNAPPRVVYLGLTSTSGDQMFKYMKQYFKRGSYDLLRKNCNSFTDCSLYYMLDTRLDPRYRGLEKIGHAADKNAGLVQTLSGGDYTPNPAADQFSLEQTIRLINGEKQKEFEARRSAFG